MDHFAVKSTTATPRDRPLLLAFAVVLLLIASAAAVFVGAYNGQRVAGLATRVQHAERAQSSANLSVVYLTQAAYLVRDSGTSVTVDRLVESARFALSTTTAELEALEALTPDAPVDTLEILAGLMEASEIAIAQLEAARPTLAAGAISNQVEPAFERLQENLNTLQRADATEINQTTSVLGRVADIVRFLLAFALPAAGMTVYRWVMNRQRTQTEMRLKVESERAINKSKDEFIANVSHELRTPLTGIVGFARLLESSDLEPSSLEVVRLIVDQSAELSRMVDDLLTAARADANALTINLIDASIQSEVDEVVRFVELMRTEVEVFCQDAMVVIDPERFRQVLRNLLVNARKHGGSKIKVRGVVKDSKYICTVIDDGAGVPTHVQERLFSRFVHTGEAPVIMGSVGLGLAIVQELCRLMDCEVSYRRVKGETWFSVTMPLAERTLQLANERLVMATA
ncbi:MAG TPA: HAMP domain-containing sensor histidine kinase [Acidimicrobiia bacterium]